MLITVQDLTPRLNKPQEAMLDAETASDFKTGTTLSVIAKAEAFYNMGQFEMALVHFYRAMRLRRDTEIENGMFKCRSAILNVVGGSVGLETDLGNNVVVMTSLFIIC